MGHPAQNEYLVTRWTELINDPSLEDLPYKIELNAEGVIEMSPANNWHAMKQAETAVVLSNTLPNGRVLTECSILTDIGVRVPDVAWASNAFLQAEQDNTPFTRAPEICVEIRSPSNTKRELKDKIRAYLAAGAIEVWIVDVDGKLTIHSAQGVLAQSGFGVSL